MPSINQKNLIPENKNLNEKDENITNYSIILEILYKKI